MTTTTSTTAASTTAASYEMLRAEIAARRPQLSPRLRQLAEHALRHPDEIALETIAVIARRAGVPPSSLIRFAHAFGFAGFSAMQRVFRAPLVARTTDYAERLQALRQSEAGTAPEAVLERLAAAGIHALEHLRATVGPERIERAAALLAGAETIHVVGQRRAFAVAAYLAYALGHLGARSRLLDGLGGMLMEQAGGMAPRDVLLAVSFAPYAPETLAAARRAEARGVPIVALTDGPLSPLVPPARVAFEVEDAELEGFRALSATMCLALALVVRLGQRLGNGSGAPSGPEGMLAASAR